MNADAVVVGLGNPGPRYAFTRHNAGFIALDLLAQEMGASFANNRKLKAEECTIAWGSHRVLLLKPQTFMNLSGESVQALYSQYNHLREKPLIVLHDEVDIPFGQVRAKLGGGDAGHNGLKSLRQCLGHGDYYRVRIGVGKPLQGSPIPLADHVLAQFGDNERELLAKMLLRSLDITELLLNKDLEKAQRLAAAPLGG